VVVALGLTDVLVPVTVPTPWSMVSLFAPATDHESADGEPGATVEGVAVNEAMTGKGTTLTVTLAVVLPTAFVAVRV